MVVVAWRGEGNGGRGGAEWNGLIVISEALFGYVWELGMTTACVRASCASECGTASCLR